MEANINIPAISVVMSVYNGEEYLKEAIESILNQTFKDFEFIIINDGSNDKSKEIILSFSDKRIKLIDNKKNLGLVTSLNKGIKVAKGKYIARMDADDISLHDRFEKQISFMERNSEIGVSSGNMEVFGKEDGISKLPISNNEIKASLLFQSAINHPASIIRTEILKKNNIYYPNEYIHMEDFALWHLLIEKTNFANLNTILIKYRKEGQNITEKNRKTHVNRLRSLYKKILTDFRINFNEEDINLHIGFKNNNLKPSFLNLKKVKSWHKKLLKHNKKIEKYPHSELEKLIADKEMQFFFPIIHFGIFATFKYWYVFKKLPKNQIIYFFKFFIKRIIKRNYLKIKPKNFLNTVFYERQIT